MRDDILGGLKENVMNNLIPDDDEYGSADKTILSKEGEEIVHAVHAQVDQDARLPVQAGACLVDLDAAVPLHVELHLLQAASLISSSSCCHHLLDQLLQPDAKVCCSKMDQPKPACPLPLVQVHPVVEEEEVGLEEDEDDLGGRPHREEDQGATIARGTKQLLLKVTSHLDARVDEGTNSSNDGAQSEEERSIFCRRFWKE